MSVAILTRIGVRIMGHFLEFMKKMVEGKPVFDTPDVKPESELMKSSDRSPATPVHPSSESLIQKHNDHTFPIVEIKQVKTHLDGENIQVYCHIKNEWEQEVMLDKIRLLGTTRELDVFLRPDEDREFLVYKGPKLRHEYHEAEIDYKTAKEGDYFRAIYEVSYTYDSMDKSYTVDEMELRQPIRDIYE